jgi:hypothetical protein
MVMKTGGSIMFLCKCSILIAFSVVSICNRFVDRDMFMRYRGGGVGHSITRAATNFFKRDRHPRDQNRYQQQDEMDVDDIDPHQGDDGIEGLGSSDDPGCNIDEQDDDQCSDDEKVDGDDGEAENDEEGVGDDDEGEYDEEDDGDESETERLGFSEL